ncbi:MAG TPA: AAA family ATPase [Gaiellaceae bacterium]|nr:AAA family ATPase [Gaiellaceae bacterium]
MAEPVRIALAGHGADVEALAAILGASEGFELVAIGERDRPSADVVVLVHEAAADPRTELASVREHSAAPVVFATGNPSTELVRFVIDAGIAEVLPLPASHDHATFVVEKAARAAEQQRTSERGARVITVFSPKGGSGKSVIATNLAVAAASHARKRTLLVDLDLQFGDSAIMLGLSPSSTVRELISSPTEVDAEKLEVYTERHASGLSVLPAPLNPEDAELVGEDAVRSLLAIARTAYDVVVVDTAPFFYGPMLATLDQTDELLVICNPDLPTLKNVRLTLKTLELLSFPSDRLRIVLNRATSASGMEPGDVSAALDRAVDVVLPLDASVPLAVNDATPSVLADPAAPFSTALLDLARTATMANGSWSRPAKSARASRLLSFGRS